MDRKEHPSEVRVRKIGTKELDFTRTAARREERCNHAPSHRLLPRPTPAPLSPVQLGLSSVNPVFTVTEKSNDPAFGSERSLVGFLAAQRV